MLCDTGQHSRPNLYAIVKRKYIIRMAGLLKNSVRAGLPLQSPTGTHQGGEDSLGLL
jgi:hypothetical protein